MLTMTFKCAASVLTYALVMTNNTHQVNFVPVGPQAIDCDGKTYQSFADAAKLLDLDKDKPTFMTTQPERQYHLPHGMAVGDAPKGIQDAITNQLINNNGTVTVGQENTVKGAFKCRFTNS